ncbi:MAG: winged helix-turn-helix transcriptional regulator [Blautia sp.]|nr:winged helix-turn-helix transcriptional regulator [Blautia sp.]
MDEKKILPHDHGSGRSCEKIMRSMPDAETVSNVADALKQLGDPSRLRIFWLLCHTEECVTDIAEYVEMSSPAVSHHLRLLKAAGLITSRRAGKEMLYKASGSAMADAFHHIIEKLAEISCPG